MDFSGMAVVEVIFLTGIHKLNRLGRLSLEAPLWVAQSADELTTLALEAVAGGAKRLVVLGGDGSINRILPALVYQETALGIIPLGRANDLAWSLGLPHCLEEAIKVALKGKVVSRGVFRLNRHHFFVTVGGLGFPALVAQWAQYGRSLWSYPFWALRLVARARPLTFTLNSGNTIYEAKTLALLFGSVNRLGHLFRLPVQRPFPFCRWLKDHSPGKAFKILILSFLGRLKGQVFFLGSDSRLRISLDSPRTFFGDGEILARGRNFTVEWISHALNLVVPAN